MDDPLQFSFIFLSYQLTVFYCFRWHLGYCNEKFLPTNRGFDSFFGYWNGAEVNKREVKLFNAFILVELQ